MTLAALLLPTASTAEWIDAALSPGWHWSEARDPITDAVIRRAYVLSTAVNGPAFGSDQARVLLTCVAGRSTITVEWTIKAAGKVNLVLAYRFEGRPGRKLNARYVNRGSQQSAAIADVRQFLKDAAISHGLYVRVTSDAFGVSEATFKAGAGADMVARFAAACPDASPH